MVYLNNLKTLKKSITIVIIDCLEPENAAKILLYCAKKWKVKNRILFSHCSISVKGITVQQIPQIDSIKKYNEFILRELYKYIDTEYCLVMQTDGFILNPKKWTNSFLQYDFIGAPLPDYPIWILHQLNIYKQAIKNCDENRWPLNGGFSLRSKKLLELTAQCPYPIEDLAEDMYISLYNRSWFEDQGIKFPSREIAYSFSRENPIMNHDFHFDDCFGFHGKFSPKQQECIKRPFINQTLLNPIKKKIFNIHQSFSLAYYIKLVLKNTFQNSLIEDEIIDFYIESKYKTSRDKHKIGNFDLVIIQNTTDFQLLDTIIQQAQKNILHNYTNCYIVTKNRELINDICVKHKCIPITIINDDTSILLDSLLKINSNRICVIFDNSIIIKPIQLFKKQKNIIFLKNDVSNSIFTNIAQLMQLKIFKTISIDSSITVVNPKLLQLFLNKYKTILQQNHVDCKTSFELFNLFITNNYPRFYKFEYLFPQQLLWNENPDFLIASLTSSLTKIIKIEEKK